MTADRPNTCTLVAVVVVVVIVIVLGGVRRNGGGETKVAQHIHSTTLHQYPSQ